MESPDLIEFRVWNNFGAIRDRITDEEGLEISNWSNRGGLWILLGFLNDGLIDRLDFGNSVHLSGCICRCSSRSRLSCSGLCHWWAVAHWDHAFAISFFSQCSHRDIPDRGAELDQGVCAIMGVDGDGFTAG